MLPDNNYAWTWTSMKNCEDIRKDYFIKVICLRPNIAAHSSINTAQFLLNDYLQVLLIGTLRCGVHYRYARLAGKE